MTAPYPAGAKAVTLAAGAAAELVTEYAVGDPALLIINDSDQRVWVAGDSSVSASNGVPLEPRTSLSWTAKGAVYAVADPAATGPAQLYATSAISEWQPSPAAIAAQTASALLASGVPNVLTTAFVGGYALNQSAASPFIDVHQYASLLVNFSGSGVPRGLQFDWYNDAQTQLQAQDLITNASSGVAGVDGTVSNVRLPVRGPRLLITNIDTGASVSVGVIGSNRPIADVESSVNPGSLMYFTAAGPTTPSTVNFTNNTQPTKLEGLAWASFIVPDTTTVATFELMWVDGGSIQRSTILADTTEMATHSGSRYVWKLLTLPRGGWFLRFVVTTAGTTGISSVRIIPAAA